MTAVAALALWPGKPIEVAKPASNNIYVESIRNYPEPREYLKQLAGEDFELLERIAICESGFRTEADNPTSTAAGIFQFISSTWDSWGEGDVYNAYDNIRAGVKLFQAKGTSPWNASRNCWE